MNTSCQCFHRVLYITLYKVDYSKLQSVGETIETEPSQKRFAFYYFLKEFCSRKGEFERIWSS